jgi:hypothetical protein
MDKFRLLVEHLQRLELLDPQRLHQPLPVPRRWLELVHPRAYHEAFARERLSRAEARRMCCARDHHFPFPEDMVKRIIGADPDHVGTSRVGHLVAFVAETALQRFHAYGALPARQAKDAIRQSRIHVQRVH